MPSGEMEQNEETHRRLESTKKWTTGSKPRRESRDESGASSDEKNLEAKIETERPLCTQGPCSDSACGRQHEGVASMVPADAAPGTAVNRQEDTVQDGHGTWTREAVTTAGLMRVADVRRPLKRKGARVPVSMEKLHSKN